MKNNKLSKKQRKLIRKIMEENDPQRRVDRTVEQTKLAMEICYKESCQTRVDKWVAEEKAKMKM